MSLADWAAAAIFAAVGLLHLAPALAAISPALLKRLYGAGADGAVLVMLQHRAVLLGIVGLLCVIAAAAPAWRMPAALAGALSMGSYLMLWVRAAPEVRKPLKGIAVADAIALPALALAVILAGPTH